MRYSEADIQEFIHDNDVKFIKFSFCDVFGNQKIISVLPSVLPRAFSQGSREMGAVSGKRNSSLSPRL